MLGKNILKLKVFASKWMNIPHQLIVSNTILVYKKPTLCKQSIFITIKEKLRIFLFGMHVYK